MTFRVIGKISFWYNTCIFALLYWSCFFSVYLRSRGIKEVCTPHSGVDFAFAKTNSRRCQISLRISQSV